jgi:hypothetical protein
MLQLIICGKGVEIVNTEKRNYYTLQELMDETMKLVKDDPEYPKALARCPLDYQSVSSSVKDERITLCEFNVLGFTEYGGSEGIYGTICFSGDWSPGCRIKSFGSIGLTAYTLKTLSDDKDAFRAMGTLVNLISYYAHELMNRNLDRFD